MISIRKAVANDYHMLMQLYNEFVGSDRYTRHNNDSFKRVSANPNNFILIAESDNQIIGFASFSIRDVIRYPRPIAELDELYVKDKFRKKNVGRMLMEKVIEKANEKNCYRLFIETHYNHKAAHKFYEALGFTNYGYHFIKDL